MPGSRISTGRLFHAAGDETANAWRPIVTVQVRGTRSSPAAAERSCERPSIELTGVRYPARYGEQNRVDTGTRGNQGSNWRGVGGFNPLSSPVYSIVTPNPQPLSSCCVADPPVHFSQFEPWRQQSLNWTRDGISSQCSLARISLVTWLCRGSTRISRAAALMTPESWPSRLFGTPPSRPLQ